MSQQDLHLTTEQLSAFLDQQLTPKEQASCSTHLQDCKQCQSVLDDLQQTVNLLRALPQLEVPRSFALPADFNVTSYANPHYHNSQIDQEVKTQVHGKKQQQVEPSIAIIKSFPNRPPIGLRRTLRAVSALAAVIGLFFALSGFLATSQPSANPAPVSNTTYQQFTQVPSQNNSSTGSPPSNKSGDQHPTSPTGTNSTATTTGPIPPFLDFNQPGVRESFGVLLAILGSMGFTLLAQRQRQTTHPVKKPSS